MAPREAWAGPEDLILAFVRGTANADDLAQLGIKVDRSAGAFRLTEPGGLPPVLVSAADLAHGLVSHSARGSSLRDWAQTVLATGAVDFSRSEEDPRFQTLLEAVWDAAGGGEPSDEAMALAQSLLA